MAKLKPIDFSHTAKTGEKFEFRSEVTVSDASGAFALTIPDELEEVATRLAKDPAQRVLITRPRQNLRVEGDNLQKCREFIALVCKDYMQCEVTEELVLVYATDIAVSYVKDDEGVIYSNGYACRAKYDSGTAKWHGTLHATNQSKFYQVGMTARIFKKITYTRSSGTTVEYQWVNNSHRLLDAWGTKLNDVVGLHWNFHDAYAMSRLNQLPYTEDAAQFFFNMLMSMCALADRVTSFMGDKDRVLAAIQANAGLLPAPNKDTQ